MRRSVPPRTARSQGGPLMTDHLHLQDLDLELELLKRKREMIEMQQQQLLGGSQSFNRPRPFDYGNQLHQPFQAQPQFNSNSLYSRYDDQPPSSGYGGGSLLGKRPMNDQPWQGHSTPKRYSGPQVAPKKKFNSGSTPKMNLTRPEPFVQRPFSQTRSQWNKPQPFKGPKSNFPSQRFTNQKNAKQVNKDFNPSKVTKAKQTNPAVKIAALPADLRDKRVTQTTQVNKGSDSDPNFILRDDQVPSQQLAGRLELALGNILKEIKAKYGNSAPHTVSFQSMFLQRQMKQAIRERLRSVMMGKYVGKAVAIVEAYRKVFPVETDAEIVQIGLDAQQSAGAKKLAIKLETAGNVYSYIKHNLNRLVGVTLDDIFEKIQKLSENDVETTKEICDKLLAIGVPDLMLQEQTKEVDKNNSDLVADDNEDAKNSTDQQNDSIKSADAGQNESEKPIVAADGDLNESKQSEDTVNTASSANEQTIDQTTDNAENKDDHTENKEGGGNRVKDDDAASRLDGLILQLLRRRLQYILPRHKTVLLKILNVSGAYQVTKNAIIERAQELHVIDKRVAEAEKSMSKHDKKNETGSHVNSPTPTRLAVSPYMVKILGRPLLPNRTAMQEFLNDFKPTSVKKHRSMHLLFVAFDNKEDFDRIVAVKETTIGNSTIYIKVNEKAPGVKADESLNTTATLNESTDSATITSELDEQITDLLSSIRKEEENKEEDAQTEVATEAGTELNGNQDLKIESVNGGDQKENVQEENLLEEIKEEPKEIVEDVKGEAKDKVEELKNQAKESGRATPTRSSSRLSNVTPCSVRTRRASRLANN